MSNLEILFCARLKITLAVVAMPLLTELRAGCTYERHRYGSAHGADLLGIGGLAVGTDDTLTAGEVLLELDSFMDFAYLLVYL